MSQWVQIIPPTGIYIDNYTAFPVALSYPSAHFLYLYIRMAAFQNICLVSQATRLMALFVICLFVQPYPYGFSKLCVFLAHHEGCHHYSPTVFCILLLCSYTVKQPCAPMCFAICDKTDGKTCPFARRKDISCAAVCCHRGVLLQQNQWFFA